MAAFMSTFDSAIDEFLGRATNFDFHVKQFYFTNARVPRFFSQADIEFDKRNRDKCFIVRHIVRPGIEYLRRYQTKTEDAEKDEERRRCLDCLKKFFEKRVHHLECLQPFMDWESYDENAMPEEKKRKRNQYSGRSLESAYQFLLAEHVFSPLIPGSGFDLDMDRFSKKVPVCPGKCGKSTENHVKIHTGIGHPDVWHGYVDIYINNTIPVMVLTENAECIGPATGDMETECGSMDTDATRDNESMDEDDIEVNVNRNDIHVLEQKRAEGQATAQAVINSFIQAKNTNGFIPTIVTTFGVMKILLYDSVNDILLISDKISLFINQDFDNDTVILLWMILNFEYFLVTPPNINESNMSSVIKANFDKQVQDKFGIYKEKLKKCVIFPSMRKTDLGPPVLKNYLQMVMKY